MTFDVHGYSLRDRTREFFRRAQDRSRSASASARGIPTGADDIHKKKCTPRPADGGPGFDLGQIEPVFLEGNQHVVKRAGMVLDRKHEMECFVSPGRRRLVVPITEKTRCSSGRHPRPGREDVQAVLIGGQFG